MKPRDLFSWSISFAGSAMALYLVFHVIYEIESRKLPIVEYAAEAQLQAAKKGEIAFGAAILTVIAAVVASFLIFLLRPTPKRNMEFALLGLKFQGAGWADVALGLGFSQHFSRACRTPQTRAVSCQ